MTTDWSHWQQRRPLLRGSHITPAGLLALSKLDITLAYDPLFRQTTVRCAGFVLGTAHQRFDWDHPFTVESCRNIIDIQGPRSEYKDLVTTPSHDFAIEQILRDHGVEPPQRVQVPNTSTVDYAYRCRSRISRAYSGPRFTPTADMSEYTRQADSIATRIRMNSARTDPMTGQKSKPTSKRPAPQTPLARLRGLYSKMLTVHRKSGGDPVVTERNLAALALAPDHHHRLVVAHMAQSPAGGIHVGNQHATRMKGTMPNLVKAMGGQVLDDRPNKRVGGVYYGQLRQMVVPDTAHSASVSTGSHEFGHALDHAWGIRLSGTGQWASSLPFFQQVYAEVTHMYDGTPTQLTPYYTDKSTGSGYREMWAESYAAWLHGTERYSTPDEIALLIGHEIGALPDQKLRVGRVLYNYFDLQDQQMRTVI